MRQYVIEYGVNVTSYTTCINTVAIGRPPGTLMSPNSGPSITTTTTSAIVTTEKQTTTNESIERPPFAVMPMVIKEEPSDYEVMSDITIETNTETYDENGTSEIARPSNSLASTIIARQKEKRNAPLVPSLMVAVNDRSLLASTSTSDVDYINAYMQTPSPAGDETSSNSTPPMQVTEPKPSTSTTAEATSTSQPKQMPPNATETETPRKEQTLSEKNTNASPKNLNKNQQKPKTLELKRLHVNLKKVSNVIIQTDKMRSSRTSMGIIELKNYFDKSESGNSNRNKPSIESTIVGGKSLRDRSIHHSSNSNSLRSKKRSVNRRKPTSANKKLKHSLRKRASL